MDNTKSQEIKVDDVWIRSIREELHRMGECGFELPRTRALIQRELEKMGVEHIVIGRGSVVARIGRGEEGILLRADMDAIQCPTEERKGREEKNDEEENTVADTAENATVSEEGQKVAHLCGHDMHTAMLLGAIRTLLQNKEKVGCEVRFLFQAGEEILEGAMDAIEHGVLLPWEQMKVLNDKSTKESKELFANKREDGLIKACFSLHCMVSVPLDVGTIVVSSAGVSASASTFF